MNHPPLVVLCIGGDTVAATFAAGFILIGMAGPLLAQDLGARWVDRITEELRSEKPPPKDGSQVTWRAEGGLIYAYDTNLFLTQRRRVSDSVLIPFARAHLSYDEPQFAVAADLTLDYKHYLNEVDLRDHEERFMGKAGYMGAGFEGSVVQLLRDESDPIDALFSQRIHRFVSDTMPRLWVDLTDVLGLEMKGHLQTVQFRENVFANARDNTTVRASLSLVCKSDLAVDFVMQGGVFLVRYTHHRDVLGNPTAPSDVDGRFLRGGARGEILPDLTVEALAGVMRLESGDVVSATNPRRDGDTLTTGDATVYLRYKMTDLVSVSLGYTREAAFFGGNDAFQIIDTAFIRLHIQVLEQLTLRMRFLVQHSSPARSEDRRFTSAEGTVSYKIGEHVVLNGGITLRSGAAVGSSAEFRGYTDFVADMGIVFGW